MPFIFILFFLLNYENVFCLGDTSSLHSQVQDTIVFSDIKNETQLEENEIVFILFYNMNFCKKCMIAPFQLFDCAVQRSKLAGKAVKPFKILAIVNCSRAIELKHFIKFNSWKYSALMYDGDPRKFLHLSPDVDMAAFSYNGDLLVEFNLFSPKSKDTCFKLIQIITQK